MNPSKRLIIVAAAILVIFAGAYAWHKSHPAPETPLDTPLLTTEPGTPPVVPAEMVSNTTFDIVSPSTQPVGTVVSESMPGSHGTQQ